MICYFELWKLWGMMSYWFGDSCILQCYIFLTPMTNFRCNFKNEQGFSKIFSTLFYIAWNFVLLWAYDVSLNMYVWLKVFVENLVSRYWISKRDNISWKKNPNHPVTSFSYKVQGPWGRLKFLNFPIIMCTVKTPFWFSKRRYLEKKSQ